MFALTLFANIPEYKVKTIYCRDWGMSPPEMDDGSGFSIISNDIMEIPPGDGEIFMVRSTWLRNRTPVTWIALYRHLDRRNNPRFGICYGAGVWLSGKDGAGAYIVPLLRYIVSAFEKRIPTHFEEPWSIGSLQINDFAIAPEYFALKNAVGVRLPEAWPGFDSNPGGTTLLVDISEQTSEELIGTALDVVRTNINYTTYTRVLISNDWAMIEAARSKGTSIARLGEFPPRPAAPPRLLRQLPARVASVQPPPTPTLPAVPAIEETIDRLLERRVAEIRSGIISEIRREIRAEIKAENENFYRKIFEETQIKKSSLIHGVANKIKIKNDTVFILIAIIIMAFFVFGSLYVISHKKDFFDFWSPEKITTTTEPKKTEREEIKHTGDAEAKLRGEAEAEAKRKTEAEAEAKLRAEAEAKLRDETRGGQEVGKVDSAATRTMPSAGDIQKTIKSSIKKMEEDLTSIKNALEKSNKKPSDEKIQAAREKLNSAKITLTELETTFADLATLPAPPPPAPVQTPTPRAPNAASHNGAATRTPAANPANQTTPPN